MKLKPFTCELWKIIKGPRPRHINLSLPCRTPTHIYVTTTAVMPGYFTNTHQ